jgi:hypothetical protein
MKWDAFWDDNQGYSIKTMLNDEIARDTHVVVGSIDYVPLGITSGAMATAIAHKITDKPVYIDLSAQEEEARQKKQTQEKDRMHKESVETRESFESANR